MKLDHFVIFFSCHKIKLKFSCEAVTNGGGGKKKKKRKKENWSNNAIELCVTHCFFPNQNENLFSLSLTVFFSQTLTCCRSSEHHLFLTLSFHLRDSYFLDLNISICSIIFFSQTRIGAVAGINLVVEKGNIDDDIMVIGG